MKYICLGYIEPGKFEGDDPRTSGTQRSTIALSTTTICAPTDILSPNYLFSLRRPR
jgi:hypothetical protein